MTQLTPEQYEFLKKHFSEYNIEDIVFDATDMGPSIYEPIMKSLGKKIAIGVTPCKKEGHTMRYGRRCAQCNVKNLHYGKRYYKAGYIYIAFSQKAQLYKIGFTENISSRKNKLNDDFYAGYRDWEILHFQYSKNAGAVERKLHQNLKNYQTNIIYDHYGHTTNAKELFRCDYSIIKNILNDVIN